jgi:hypothetical protein
MRRCKPQKLFGEIEQEAQPSADAYINTEKYEVIDGVFDPESESSTIETQQDDEMPADAAWTNLMYHIDHGETESLLSGCVIINNIGNVNRFCI